MSTLFPRCTEQTASSPNDVAMFAGDGGEEVVGWRDGGQGTLCTYITNGWVRTWRKKYCWY